MATLLLTRKDVKQLLSPAALFPELRAAFQSYSLERSIAAQRARSPLPGQKNSSAMVLFPGLLADVPAYTVKVHAKFPSFEPAIQGTLHLRDIETGSLLAIMDSTYITAVRTGLAGAIAADVLARSDADTVAIIGAGVQGELQLRSLALVRPLKQVSVYDTVFSKAANLASRMSAELGISVTSTASLTAAVAAADIIITATWSRAPFLFPDMVQAGTHITTLGPDEPGKCEVDADLIRQSLFVCDDRDLAVQMGAICGAGLGSDAIHAELGEIIGQRRSGRITSEQITVYGGVGLAFQDLTAAWQVYNAAQKTGIGCTLDFLD